MLETIYLFINYSPSPPPPILQYLQFIYKFGMAICMLDVFYVFKKRQKPTRTERLGLNLCGQVKTKISLPPI